MNAVITKLDTNVHKRYLLKILLDISRDKILSKYLVFKGGTALMFFYGLDRFSTDLDFDLIYKTGEKEEDFEKEILNRLEKILRKHGNLKDLQNKRYTIFALFSYSKIDYNIKIEISKRGVFGNYKTRNLIGIDLQVTNPEDMFANKLIALLSRKNLANRDIYDIYFLDSKGFFPNKDLILEKTGYNFETYILKCINFLEKLPKNYNILDGLGVVLSQAKKQEIKKNLVNEVIVLLRSYLI